MKEDFLHFIWQYKKLNVLQLKTTQQESLEIISGGILNFHSGPDFFNGLLRIGGQVWAGNIEVHIKSSDWFLHNHETDPAYDNVILHVVYEHDTDIFRRDNSIVPTLELKHHIDHSLLASYRKLFAKTNTWINCQQDLPRVSKFIINNWLERLYIERLETKAEQINHLLATSKNDWEAVLFKLLAKNFGLKVNGDAFFAMANSVEISVLRKVQSQQGYLEALFFGQCGLLESDQSHSTRYLKTLQDDYQFLKQKFQLDSEGVVPLKFFRLRPSNFPTIRLSQLASLYSMEDRLFSKLMEIEELSGFYSIFDVGVSDFWKTHYTFEKASKHSHKQLTTSFIDLLVVNTVLPIKFCYFRQQGKAVDALITLMGQTIKPEENTIIKGFRDLGLVCASALESQALIRLKTAYCDKNKCLKCAIGNTLLSK